MVLIGRLKETADLTRLYNSDSYIINVYGPPKSGKSKIINSFLDGINTYELDISLIDWESVTDVYQQVRSVFCREIDDPIKDIVNLAFMFNSIIKKIAGKDI